MAIMMVAMMSSCTKEETPTVYKPIDYISIPRAEYTIYNGVVTQVRYSISNQSNKTLYYCKFRVTQCTEEGIEYYSQTYEIGAKNDKTVWTLPAGDIQLTGYYNVNFLHTDNGHIKEISSRPISIKHLLKQVSTLAKNKNSSNLLQSC